MRGDSSLGISRRSKSVYAAVLMIITSLIVCGCSIGANHPDFLTQHEWVRYCDCDETISFGEDGHYSYYCSCGEPVGDSDLFDKYSYDEGSGEIKLKPGGSGDTIKVLRCEKSRLLLDFGGGVIREFVDSKDSLASAGRPSGIEYDSDNITSGFCSYVSVLELDGRKTVTGPAGYDGDDPEYEEYRLEELLSMNAEFYDWNLSVVQTEEGEVPESSFRKLTAAEAEELVSGGSATGFVWYNEEAEICKIVFFGSTLYYE